MHTIVKLLDKSGEQNLGEICKIANISNPKSNSNPYGPNTTKNITISKGVDKTVDIKTAGGKYTSVSPHNDGFHSRLEKILKYEGDDWFGLYNRVKENGGDGFYGGLSVPYQEPVMEKYYSHYNWDCPNAEEVQPKMMQFKCNYRNLEEAQLKLDILKKSLKLQLSERMFQQMADTQM